MEVSRAPDPYFIERRRYGRIVSHLKVAVLLFSGNRIGDQLVGKIINISKEGIGVVLRSNVSPGTRVELTIFAEIDQSAGSGEVIWRKEVKGRTVHGIKISQWSHFDPSIENELPL